MNVAAIIPARYASSRFPGKPLMRETGKYLIQHCCERVRASQRIQQVVVATDDQRIADAVRSFGGQVRMTRADHVSGSDRVAECAAALGLADDDLVLNVQGDEPEIDPRDLDALVDLMLARPQCRMGTLACPFPKDGPREGPGSPADPNCVKVVLDASGDALYFSRSLIPYPRDTGGRVDDPSRWLLHVGVYAFRMGLLQAFGRLGHASERTNLEDVERLEQLRALEWGRDATRGVGPMAVALVQRAAVGVDTPEDYAAFVARTRSAKS